MDPWLVHGGRLDAARAAFPDAPQPWVDLSTGINPVPWPVARAGAIDWARLPGEAQLRALEAAAARVFGTSADRVCAVPGSEIGLRLLASLDLPTPHRHVTPGYGTHAEALPGSRPVAFGEIGGGSPDGTILFANPSNPDGPSVDRDAIAALLARGTMLVVDEAFADVAPDRSVAAIASDRLIVLRSFGKFFGLAGVRLGFMIAAPERLASVRARLGSWPLSAAALAIGTAAYSDHDWIAATRVRLIAEAARLDGLLARNGLITEGCCPLFRLVRTPDAGALFARLAGAGLWTRPFAGQPDWLRIGLPGDDAAFDRLGRALRDG